MNRQKALMEYLDAEYVEQEEETPTPPHAARGFVPVYHYEARFCLAFLSAQHPLAFPLWVLLLSLSVDGHSCSFTISALCDYLGACRESILGRPGRQKPGALGILEQYGFITLISSEEGGWGYYRPGECSRRYQAILHRPELSQEQIARLRPRVQRAVTRFLAKAKEGSRVPYPLQTAIPRPKVDTALRERALQLLTPYPVWLTPGQAAEALGYDTPDAIYRAVKLGHLPTKQIGNKRAIIRSDLIRAVAEGHLRPPALRKIPAPPIFSTVPSEKK